MTKKKIWRDLSGDNADELVSMYKELGCTVKKERQSDGKYKVTAECPDK